MPRQRLHPAAHARRAPSPSSSPAPTPGNQARLRLVARDPRAIARSGFDGGGPLPHRDTLRRVFGRYDIEGIRAHRGPAAHAASRMLGATAYTMGEDVAFGDAPSLGTTAHEVTHALAQRAGYRPSGAMGRPGDRYEKLAHAVSDRAKRGLSAEGLLDRAVGPAGRAPGPRSAASPVQREIGTAAEVGDMVSSYGTRFTITAVEDAPGGKKTYRIASPDLIMPLEVSSDSPDYDLYVEAPESPPAETLKAKPGLWSRMSSRWSKGKSKVEKATKTGSHAYGRMEVDEADEDRFDRLETAKGYDRFTGSMGVSHTSKSTMFSRLGTGIDAVSSASQFGADRAIDRALDMRVTPEERIRRTLPKSTTRKIEEKVGQLFQVLGGVVQTAVPVVGGALASPLTGLGDSMETHSGGIAKSKSLTHGAMTSGKDVAIGAIPGYGNYVGFVGMCSDAKRLLTKSSGPTKRETLVQLAAQRDELLAIGDELRELGYDPARELPGYSTAIKTFNAYIRKYEAIVAARSTSGTAKLLKHSGGFFEDDF